VAGCIARTIKNSLIAQPPSLDLKNDLADFDKNDLLDIMESAFLIKNKY
jgi:hypothetical protein